MKKREFTLIELLVVIAQFLCDFAEKAITVFADAKNVITVDFSKGAMCIIGNEGNGVSDEFISIANKKIAIPMAKGVESLNAGVAGSIIMQKLNEI